MTKTPKEKLKDPSLLCALVAFSILSQAPLLASDTQADEEIPVQSRLKKIPTFKENVLEKARKIALFIADESDEVASSPTHIHPIVSNQNDSPVEDTSRALALVSPGFNFSLPNPFASLTSYVKDVDWRKTALFILGEEDTSEQKDSDPKKLKASSDEDQSQITSKKPEEDEGSSFRQSNPLGESEDVDDRQESSSNNGNGDEVPSTEFREQSEDQQKSRLGEGILADSDSAKNGDKSLVENGPENAPDFEDVEGQDQGEKVQSSHLRDEDQSDNGSVLSGDEDHEEGSLLLSEDQGLKEGSEGLSTPDEQPRQDDDKSSNALSEGGDLEREGVEVKGDSDDSFSSSEPVKSRSSRFIATPSPEKQKLAYDAKEDDRSPFQSPRKPLKTPSTPKAKAKAIVEPKTPEQAGYKVKTKTNIGPIYHGLTYTYTNPKGEEKTVTGSRLAHFVGNSPHPKKFVLIQAQSPSKARTAPYVIKFNKGVAAQALEEVSSSEDSSENGSSEASDSSSGDEGSSDESGSRSNGEDSSNESSVK